MNGFCNFFNQLIMNLFFRTQIKKKGDPNYELLKSYFFQKNCLNQDACYCSIHDGPDRFLVRIV